MKGYDEKLKATIAITEFMGELAGRYSAQDMHKLWSALSVMCRRYGEVFVSDAIGKDRKDAELALFRYAKRIKEQEEEKDITIIEPPAYRKHRTKRYGRRLGQMALTSLIAIAVAVAFSISW